MHQFRMTLCTYYTRGGKVKLLHQMDKKIQILIVSLLVLVLCGGIGIAYWFARTGSTAEMLVESISSPTPTPFSLQTWEDPAGFIIDHPDDVLIQTHEQDDDINYAHLEFTHQDHPGSLIVWVKDLPIDPAGNTVLTLEEWKRLSPYTEANSIDTTLGGEEAIKIQTQSPEQKLLTVTIYDDLLFLVDTTPIDTSYWTAIHETVSDSFVLVPLEILEAQGGGGGAPVYTEYVDEEEILE